jgi:hypothetical protein
MFQPRLDVLPPAQLRLWPMLASLPRQFVLYGGTAVALRCGHRVSEDFDFFSAAAFSPDALLSGQPWLARAQILQRSPDTLTVQASPDAEPVKCSFFGPLHFGQIRTPDCAADNRLKVASAEDLLALKLGVIQQRVEAKDYLDIHALLESGLSLAEALSHLETLHPLATNPTITLKTLVYFKGGDLESLPASVKEALERAVQAVRDIPTFSGIKTPIGSGVD